MIITVANCCHRYDQIVAGFKQTLRQIYIHFEFNQKYCKSGRWQEAKDWSPCRLVLLIYGFHHEEKACLAIEEVQYTLQHYVILKVEENKVPNQKAKAHDNIQEEQGVVGDAKVSDVPSLAPVSEQLENAVLCRKIKSRLVVCVEDRQWLDDHHNRFAYEALVGFEVRFDCYFVIQMGFDV